MKKIIIISIIILVLYSFFGSSDNKNKPQDFDKKYNNSKILYNYNDGYDWAESNDIEDFSDCDYKFEVGTEAEDGCNEYVQENNYWIEPSFKGYECTEDCSGHEAGYQWAEENGITDSWDCDGKSNSFIKGCEAYAKEYSC